MVYSLPRPLRIALGLCAVASLVGCRDNAERASGDAALTPVSIAVENFAVRDTAPPGWSASAFADSLRARLDATGAVHSIRGFGGSPQFVVRGIVSAGYGRLKVSVRLSSAVDEAPLWESTFWRDASALGETVDAVAIAVAEAAAGEVARRTMHANTRERRQ